MGHLHAVKCSAPYCRWTLVVQVYFRRIYESAIFKSALNTLAKLLVMNTFLYIQKYRPQTATFQVHDADILAISRHASMSHMFGNCPLLNKFESWGHFSPPGDVWT